MNKNLVCRRLSKHYGEGPKALDNINISIPASGIFALIGRNGAGKTTLTRILATELMPTSGSATIDGLDVVKDAEALRERIAILPQEGRAIPWVTPRQNIYSYLLYRGYSMHEAKARVHEALVKVGMGRYADRLSRQMSGGMKRKVLVATILASEADIIFVDEPTTGLDPISRAELWDVMNKLKKTHFIFLTTHYLEEAEKLADQIGILDSGRLVGIGTMEQLRKKVKYQYSVRILQNGRALKPRTGYTVKGSDGSTQIITTEDEADRLAKKLIGERTRFAINPISLEDIFYYMVKKPIKEEEEEDEEEYY
jgi:ABC-2 type transport system ATP-binding protein